MCLSHHAKSQHQLNWRRSNGYIRQRLLSEVVARAGTATSLRFGRWDWVVGGGRVWWGEGLARVEWLRVGGGLECIELRLS